jgi:GT2 family glycosyltransferase
MKVVVTYNKDTLGLTATLVMLQSQVELPTEIIIIDTSKDKSGLEIAKRYNYNLIPIKVVCEQVGINKAWNIGIEESGKKDNLLIINDDLVMPVDLIKRLNYIFSTANPYCVVPKTVDRTHCCGEINMVYKPICLDVPLPSKVEWMPGFCFALNKKCFKDIGMFDDKFFCWFGDTDYEKRINDYCSKNKRIGIVMENKAFVYHFGGKSYEYQSDIVKNLIDKDRKYFYKKYPEEKL